MHQPDAGLTGARAPGTRASLRAAFFAVLGAYLYLLGAVGQPTVHGFFDPVAVRDAGTVWSALTWRVADGRHFLPAAVLNYHDGPVEFLVLNGYYALVGDLVPLGPATAQLPNTVAALVASVLAWRLGRSLGGDRLGYAFALSLALSPWLGVALRLPWLHITFGTVFKLGVLDSVLRLVAEPAARAHRVLAPLWLAAYLGASLDRPAFLLALVVLAAASGRARALLANRWLLVPAAVLAGEAAWTVALLVYGRWGDPAHAHLWKQSRFVYAFLKGGALPAAPGLARLAEYALTTFGLALPLAPVGLVLALRRPRAGGAPARGPRAFWLAAAAWAALFTPPVLWESSIATYGYVVGIPLAALAAVALARLSAPAVALLAATMALVQIAPLWLGFAPIRHRDDPRVLAAATFLVERRPDLLGPTKRALLPHDAPANVGQYARGQEQRVVMPADYPATRRASGVGSREAVLRDFVDAYERDGVIRADWLMLTSGLVGGEGGTLYARLARDPRIAWIAAFPGPHGRMLWLGEVRPGGPPLPLAPRQDVAALAATYVARYDRISFLRRNAAFVLHY